jgi:hypothetical protein
LGGIGLQHRYSSTHNDHKAEHRSGKLILRDGSVAPQNKKEEPMLSLKDCLDFCDLDSCEIEAIAEHENLPVIIAAQLSNELLKTPEGVCCLYCMVLENLNQAMTEGDMDKVLRFGMTYQHLQANYPIAQYAQ